MRACVCNRVKYSCYNKKAEINRRARARVCVYSERGEREGRERERCKIWNGKPQVCAEFRRGLQVCSCILPYPPENSPHRIDR